jgi:glucoamylase
MRRPTGLAVAAAVPVLLAGPVAGGLWWYHRDARTPLMNAGVAVAPDGSAREVPAAAGAGTLLPGSRVLAVAGTTGEDGRDDAGGAARTTTAATSRDEAAARALAAQQLAWLGSGTVPGRGTPWADTVRDAMLDLRTLTELGPGTGTGATDRPGAVVASWPASWRYVWPRDAAFVAVAFARTGHAGDAAAVLAFLQSVQGPDGLFEARYRPDGSGPPDARGIQLDGTGWALWATAQVARELAPGPRRELLERLRPLVDRASDAAVRLTAHGLPPVSRDYWELPEKRPTLGVAAPIAAGLEAAAWLQAELGDEDRLVAVNGAADRLGTAVRAAFGNGYPRYPGGDERDAAVAFLLPPFAAAAEPGVVAAYRAAATELRQPAGGIAPGGAGWRDDGVAWTPETAVFALVAASVGDRDRAAGLLTWLARHRTPIGSMPEKVRSDGRPAGPAPLAWTAAAVVLAAATLDGAGGQN